MKVFNPRELMIAAINAMKASRHEHRSDGKACPMVGAVLWQMGHAVQHACRGELRDGDHAEYTLIERKNRDKNLEQSTLFATLEPCAPEARKHPKVSCAQRIVNARIKRVYVGIEDPDPTVDRKGIKFLQDNGVEVRMFDRDLQDEIIAANADFIRQAKDRATESKNRPPKSVKLSTLEDVPSHTTIGDLSDVALSEYRQASGIADEVGSKSFNRKLAQHGLLKLVKDEFVPTGVGVVLFGSRPRSILRQAGLLATISYSSNQEETAEFDGPTISIPDSVEKWLRDKLPNVNDRNQMKRTSKPPLPFDAVREGIVNALVHRDYDIIGAKCQLIVSPETITIRSPGAPVSPITVEQLQDFSAPMLTRNPELHYVFSKLGLAEERGLGLRTLKAAATGGLPLPTYTFHDPYLTLTIFRNAEAVIHSLAPSVAEKLNDDEKAGLEFLASTPKTTKATYADHFGFDARKAQRHLGLFVELGLAKRVGSGRSTAYEVVR